jgi:hypothetical protein
LLGATGTHCGDRESLEIAAQPNVVTTSRLKAYLAQAQSGFWGSCWRCESKAQVLRPALFIFVREQIGALANYKQNYEQGGDQNYVRCSVHVIKQAIDFVHVYLLRAGVKPGIIVG